MKFQVYRTLFTRQWRWRLRASNNRIIANSGEGYHNRVDCLRGIDLVMKSRNTPIEMPKEVR